MGEDTDSKNTIKSTYPKDIDEMMIKKLRGGKRYLKDQYYGILQVPARQ